MSERNWDEVAKREFKTMDDDWQKDWAELRRRVML
jgi:hypothetical protein